MADVEFNEPSFDAPPRTVDATAPSRFSALILKTGLAKDEKSAQVVLLAVAILCGAIAALIYMVSAEPAPVTPTVTEPVVP